MNKQPNIFWITIDAARKDRFSCYGYEKKLTPNIDSLAQKSIVFNRAYTNAPWTLPAVSSMFTGRYPCYHNLLTDKEKLPKSCKTIAEVLSDEGYDTIMINQNGGWINSLYGLTRGFKKVYDSEGIFFSYFPGLKKPDAVSIPNYFKKRYRSIPARIAKLLRKNNTSLIYPLLKSELLSLKKPFFLYLHLMGTHLLYKPPLQYQKFGKKHYEFVERYFGDWREKRYKQWAGCNAFSSKEFNILNDLYDNALYYVDSQIGTYLELIKNMDLDANTIVIITADHGENIGDHGLIDHMFSLHDTLLQIPLIIYAPGSQPKTEDRIVESKNIFEAILNISNGKQDDFFPESDFAFGEFRALDNQVAKVKKYGTVPFRTGKFIRTKNLKYIKYDNQDGLFSVAGEEKPLDRSDVKGMMAQLMKATEKNHKRKKFNF